MFKSNTSLKSSPVPLPLPLPLGVPWHPSLIPTRTRTRSPPPGTIPGPQPLAPQAAAAGGTDRGCPYRGYPHRDRPQARQLATGSRPSLAGWAAVAVTAPGPRARATCSGLGWAAPAARRPTCSPAQGPGTDRPPGGHPWALVGEPRPRGAGHATGTWKPDSEGPRHWHWLGGPGPGTWAWPGRKRHSTAASTRPHSRPQARQLGGVSCQCPLAIIYICH